MTLNPTRQLLQTGDHLLRLTRQLHQSTPPSGLLHTYQALTLDPLTRLEYQLQGQNADELITLASARWTMGETGVIAPTAPTVPPAAPAVSPMSLPGAQKHLANSALADQAGFPSLLRPQPIGRSLESLGGGNEPAVAPYPLSRSAGTGSQSPLLAKPKVDTAASPPAQPLSDAFPHSPISPSLHPPSPLSPSPLRLVQGRHQLAALLNTHLPPLPTDPPSPAFPAAFPGHEVNPDELPIQPGVPASPLPPLSNGIAAAPIAVPMPMRHWEPIAPTGVDRPFTDGDAVIDPSLAGEASQAGLDAGDQPYEEHPLTSPLPTPAYAPDHPATLEALVAAIAERLEYDHLRLYGTGGAR
ncbi:MAG: hypothetical protein ACHWZW_20860 [Spirulina sp.]